MARVRRLDELDYYELLGLERDASGDAIKRAFHAFARRYHPDLHRDDPTRLRRTLRIYRRGTEAYRVLSNPASRGRYDAGLPSGQLRFDPAQAHAGGRASIPAGQTGLRSARARPFVAKALQAIKAGDYSMAKLNLQIALQHEPGNRELQERLREVEQRLG